MSGPTSGELPLTDNASISAALRALSAEMTRIGTAMDYYGGFGPMGAHSIEMHGAAGIAAKWADGVDALTDSTQAPDVSQEAGKRDTFTDWAKREGLDLAQSVVDGKDEYSDVRTWWAHAAWAEKHGTAGGASE